MHPPRVQRDRRYSSMSWRKARDEVLRRDGFTCQACGRKGDPRNARLLVADHKVPPHRYAGAFADVANLWTLCKACNNSKGDATVEEWRARSAAPSSYRRPPSTPIIRPEHTQGRPPTSDSAFVGWALALENVSAEPDHTHGRWEARIEVHTRGARFAVCPASCASPVRWPR